MSTSAHTHCKASYIDMNLVHKRRRKWMWVYVFHLNEVIGCTFLALQAPLNDQKAQRHSNCVDQQAASWTHIPYQFTDTDKTLRYTHKQTHLLLQALKDSQPQVKTDPIFCLLWHRSSSVCVCASILWDSAAQQDV